jgi:hypothetical protein
MLESHLTCPRAVGPIGTIRGIPSVTALTKSSDRLNDDELCSVEGIAELQTSDLTELLPDGLTAEGSSLHHVVMTFE